MIIKENNIDKVLKHEQVLLRALLRDLADINSYGKPELEIHWNEDESTDIYGIYTLRFKNSDRIVGIEMTLNELDTNICTLIDYLEYALR